MERKKPSFQMSLGLTLVCLAIIIIGTLILKLRAEILLCIMAMVTAFAAKMLGYTWNELEDAIAVKMGKTTSVLLIIWVVGMVVGAFMYAGAIPMIIYYGLKMINPQLVVVSAFFTCLIFSMITGSSWSSAGTAGVAFMGVAQGLGVPLHITAGAIVSGAIFGDKMSPLSETTNLAPLCAGANLYDHIRAMFWTTIPATVIAVTVYFFVGRNYGVAGAELPESTLAMLASLEQMYKWHVVLVIPFVIILFGAFTKKPPVPTLFFSVLSAFLIGWLYQGFSLADGFTSGVSGFKTTMITDGEIAPEIVSLLNRGGMTSMVSVILIVFCGYSFAAILSKAGFLDVAFKPVSDKVKTGSQAVLAALFGTFFIFVATGSAYIAFILVPELLRKKFIETKVAPMVLSRSLEDVGTVFGALLPWSSSAAFYTATLGVALYGAEGYATWSILSYTVPVIAVICAVTGLGIYKLTDEEQAEAYRKLEELQ